MDINSLKSRLAEDISKYRFILYGIFIAVIVATSLCAKILLIGKILSLCVHICVSVGMYKIYLNIVFGEEIDYTVLWNFDVNEFAHLVAVYVVKSILVGLWGLLLYVPGYIKYFEYSLSSYIAIDNPDLSVKQCLQESKRLMDGHKMDMFKMTLIPTLIMTAMIILIAFGLPFLLVVKAFAGGFISSLLTIVTLAVVLVAVVVISECLLRMSLTVAEFYASLVSE